MAAVAISCAVLAAGTVWASISLGDSAVKSLALILVVCAVTAELLTTNYTSAVTMSAAFVAGVLGATLVDPGVGFFIATLATVSAWLVERYRWRAMLINVTTAAVPTLVAGAAFHAISPPSQGALFALAVGGAAVLTMALNFAGNQPLFAILDGDSPLKRLRTIKGLLFPVALNSAVVAVIAEIYVEFGLTALIFVLLNVLVFTYMTRLVTVARERTRQYANLSWGVLSSLIRTLNERDSRASRHCAAVAAFSRDIAKQMGHSKDDQELAHTAGLLHDIGKFALSDRVMERGGLLDEADWRSIRRHPEIGADLLQDIGVYGPVAEIVKAHHERIDGRGYPGGLTGEQIPDLAKIVAVAEVYDTLTAPDTYRTPMTSFEALNELRRVSGSQLDPRCVEAMAELLAGRGMEYRHADEADFDAELDIERRMNEAAAPSA